MNPPPVAEPEGTSALAQNRPNPFNPDTDIDFSAARAGRVQLTIYDVQGRRVRALVDEVMERGDHHVHWDGTDDHGHAVATGIYFCRMRAGDFRATRKMVMLK